MHMHIILARALAHAQLTHSHYTGVRGSWGQQGIRDRHLPRELGARAQCDAAAVEASNPGVCGPGEERLPQVDREGRLQGGRAERGDQAAEYWGPAEIPRSVPDMHSIADTYIQYQWY